MWIFVFITQMNYSNGDSLRLHVMNTQQKCPHCITQHSHAIAWLLSHCFTCLLLINQMFTLARLLTGKVQICKLAVSGVRLQILISNSNAQSSTPLIYTHYSKNMLQKCWYQSTLWLLLWCMLWNKTCCQGFSAQILHIPPANEVLRVWEVPLPHAQEP